MSWFQRIGLGGEEGKKAVEQRKLERTGIQDVNDVPNTDDLTLSELLSENSGEIETDKPTDLFNQTTAAISQSANSPINNGSSMASSNNEHDIRINVSPEDQAEFRKQAEKLYEEAKELEKSDILNDKISATRKEREAGNLSAKAKGFINLKARDAYYHYIKSEEKDKINSQISQLREKYQEYFKKAGINDENIQKQILLSVQYAYNHELDLISNSSFDFSFKSTIDSMQKKANEALINGIKDVTGKEADTNTNLIADLAEIDKETINKLRDKDYNYYKKEIEKLGYPEDETEQKLSEYKTKCNNIYEQFQSGKITQNEFINMYKEIAPDIKKLGAKNIIDVKFKDNEKSPIQKAKSPDGIIDPSSQGKNGNCQALAALNAMSRTSWGAQAIKEAIKYDDKGNITVTFKGADGSKNQFSYNRTEVLDAQINEWTSTGDFDTAAIELALKEYSGLDKSEELDPFSTKGSIGEIAKLFCNKDEINFISIHDENFEDVIKKYGKNAAITCGFKYNIKQFIPSEYQLYFSNNHAYSVTGITEENGEKYVTVINPWFSEDEIKIKLNDFNNVVSGIQISIPKDKA